MYSSEPKERLILWNTEPTSNPPSDHYFVWIKDGTWYTLDSNGNKKEYGSLNEVNEWSEINSFLTTVNLKDTIITRFVNDQNMHKLIFTKHRDGNAVQPSDELGDIGFRAYSGDVNEDFNSLPYWAMIRSRVDGNVTDGSVPTRIIFQTTEEGATSRSNKVIIDNKGNLNVLEGDIEISSVPVIDSNGIIYYQGEDTDQRYGRLGEDVEFNSVSIFAKTSGQFQLGNDPSSTLEQVWFFQVRDSGKFELRNHIVNPNTNAFGIDANTNNINIGVNSASEKLHVNEFIRADSGYKVGSTTVIDSSRNFSGNSAEFANMPTVDGNPIVESGSNSDGRWIRWADGTQICFREVVDFTFTDDSSYAYAQTFISPPSGYLSSGHVNSASIRNTARVGVGCAENIWRLRNTSGIESITSDVYLTAIGRWY